jgi:Arc/MetJ-type ribon-helix-helix transcriptional regulator
VANKKITLSLPEEDLRVVRAVAARRGISVSKLVAEMLRELVEREAAYEAAKERSIAQMREGLNLGTGGHISWSRDDTHER